MSRKGLPLLAGLMVALAALFGCARGGSSYIRDIQVAPDRVIPESQQLVPVELAYYMDPDDRKRTNVVANTEGAGGFRVHVGKLLDESFQRNLAAVYAQVAVLPSEPYDGEFWGFDYPGIIIVRMGDVAINPVNQTIRMGMTADFLMSGKRKVGSSSFTTEVAPRTLDPERLTEDNRELYDKGDAESMLRLAMRVAVNDLMVEFFRVQPRLLKPVKWKGRVIFQPEYTVPLGIDFAPGEPELLTSEGRQQAMKLAALLRRHPEARVRLEVHAFDHIDQAGPLLPKQIAPRRAETLIRFLAQHGIDPARIETLPLEDGYPIADNATRAGWEQNDRVDVVVLH